MIENMFWKKKKMHGQFQGLCVGKDISGKTSAETFFTRQPVVNLVKIFIINQHLQFHKSLLK